MFQGLIEDRFEPVITRKAQALGCEIVSVGKAPDNARLIREGVEKLLDAGAEVVITTAGLSVDPDDVTRKGLVDAGLRDMLYGIPVLPGAMSLVGSLGGEGPSAPRPCAGCSRLCAVPQDHGAGRPAALCAGRRPADPRIPFRPRARRAVSGLQDLHLSEMHLCQIMDYAERNR